MRKNLLIISFLASLLLAPLAAVANEPLLDNHLDLKTDRLNKEQSGAKSGQQTTVDERLFNSEEIEKLKKAQARQENLQKQESEQLFINKSLTAKEVDTETLFMPDAKAVETVAAQNDVATTVNEIQNTSVLMPLLVMAAALTLFSIVFYHWKKRG